MRMRHERRAYFASSQDWRSRRAIFPGDETLQRSFGGGPLRAVNKLVTVRPANTDAEDTMATKAEKAELSTDIRSFRVVAQPDADVRHSAGKSRLVRILSTSRRLLFNERIRAPEW